MKRSCLTLAALAALLLIPVTHGPAAPAAVHTDGQRTSEIIPPQYCLGVLGSDWERIFCSDGKGGI
jgi:hypothetical protein